MIETRTKDLAFETVIVRNATRGHCELPAPSRHTKSSPLLLIQNAICLGINLLFVSGAQFALMFHLRGASLRVAGMAGI
jgi:hypothetical protein